MPLPHIQVHPSGRTLMTEAGTPFFWLGDTAWELFHRLMLGEAEHYLSRRAAQGFTLIQAVALAEFDGLRAPNANGDLALVNDDPSRPNEPYFAHVDAIVRLAAAHGLYIGLLPTWGDKVTTQRGAGQAVFTPASARQYGEWLGRRYAGDSNIIWILGGDRLPVHADGDDRPTWRAMAEGIVAGLGRRPLMTYHIAGGMVSTSRDLHAESWLDIHTMQSGHGSGHDTPVWEAVAHDYALEPARPVIDLEPNYEDHPVDPWPTWDPARGYFREDDVRRQIYRAVFAGACGSTYGHHAVWQFCGPRLAPINYADRYWHEAVERPAASQLIHLRRLIESRPFFARVPDQSVIAGEVGAGAAHMRACRAGDGSYAMVYVPSAAHELEVDLARLAGAQVRAWWYDTHTGAAYDAGIWPGGERRRVASPLAWHDWVLALDDAAAGFGPPGDWHMS